MDGSDGPSHDVIDRQVLVRAQRRPRSSDAIVGDIAEQIARALPLPPPDDPSAWSLARAAELPAEDEERVIRALARHRPVERPHRPE